MLSTNNRDLLTVSRWLGLSELELAGLIEAAAPEMACWCQHETHALATTPPELGPLHRLVDQLQFSFASPDDAHVWLATPNHSLGGLRPLDMLHAGAIDELHQALEASLQTG